MLLSPLQNTVSILGKDIKPVVTQHFGENPSLYKKFGWLGHEGTDYRAAVGTMVYAPIEGTIDVKDSGDKGYGLHVVISNGRLKVVLAHLSMVDVHSQQVVRLGDFIGRSGNSGNSQAPHLHMTVMKMNGPQVVDKDNGYGGGFNCEPYTICWRGTLEKDFIS